MIPKSTTGTTRRSSSRTSTTRGSAPACCPGFGNTTPIDAFKNGDFSALLTGQQIGVDALGRPIIGGQIFNPATTRLVNGVPVRDPYPGNIIPANDPLRSPVAAQIAALMVQPDRPGMSFNVAGNPAGDQTWELNARNILVRVDHGFSPNFRMSHSFYWNQRPSIRNCGGVGGCTTRVRRRDRARRRTPTTSARASTSASPRTTPTSSSTGSSATTC